MGTEADQTQLATRNSQLDRAALRGNPSFVWRAGQDRRLGMILAAAPLPLERVLVDGCGVGMYVRALQEYAPEVYGLDIEGEHLLGAVENAPGSSLVLGRGEQLPYPDNSFDLLLSHEVIEHVQDDRLAAVEMARVLRVGGRAVIFAPNRLYPFETHGHYWQGGYHFGNTPLINYLPDKVRDRLAPHVRAYTRWGLLSLFVGQPVRVISHRQIYPGYDNLVRRRPALGRWLRRITYGLEHSPLMAFGLSHVLVVEKVSAI
ncbi:MAG: methyltransferase domain-containing protein [Caldilineaceae bacterium]|nr:methyltransferase domain-containing protein [Caldilineaceae bacterium]HRJ44531.1 class I SAM-dependent methyltransferase [Caldilineaceae bacterium]